MPTVLIADDDPVSLRFLQTAIESLGCEAIAVSGGISAMNAIASTRVDLLMLDLHMPDTDGRTLLQALRERGERAPAIATSAEIDPSIGADLRAAGFDDTLVKPASLESIEKVLLRYVDPPRRERFAQSRPAAPDAALLVLDDANALAAIGGDRDAMSALRGIFAQELDTIETDLRTANALRDSVALCARLHRLRASSGFCGATALGAAALRLQQALNGSAGGAPAALADFMQVCRATQRALAAQA